MNPPAGQNPYQQPPQMGYQGQPPGQNNYYNQPPPQTGYQGQPPGQNNYYNQPPPQPGYQGQPPAQNNYYSQQPPQASYPGQPPAQNNYYNQPPPQPGYQGQPPPQMNNQTQPPPQMNYSVPPHGPANYYNQPPPPQMSGPIPPHGPMNYSMQPPPQAPINYSIQPHIPANYPMPPHAPVNYSMMPPQLPPHLGPPPMQPVININRNHRRGDDLQPGSWLPITEPIVMVGLGWDFTGTEAFDLDASITALDAQCNVIEPVYYDHKRGLNGSVIHYGDNRTGVGEGDDEVIQVMLNQVPFNVHFLAVTVNSFKKNSLIRARSAYIRIYTQTYHIGKYILKKTKDCIGLLLGVFERDPAQNIWYFRVMADPIEGHKVTLSYESIKALLGKYTMIMKSSRIVHPLPGEPVFTFNKYFKLPDRFTYVGLGWNIQAGFNYDLDASILAFDSMNNNLEIIYHKNMQSYDRSIIHYGDNRTGIGEGDDEVLSIDFAHLNPNIFTMAVLINSFKENSLMNVKDAFIRLYDTQAPLGVHVLTGCPDCIGLCIGLFRKNPTTGIWCFAPIKEIVSGNECTKSIYDVVAILNKYPLTA